MRALERTLVAPHPPPPTIRVSRPAHPSNHPASFVSQLLVGPLQRGIKMLIYVRCASQFAYFSSVFFLVFNATGSGAHFRFGWNFRWTHKKDFCASILFSPLFLIFCLLFSTDKLFLCCCHWVLWMKRDCVPKYAKQLPSCPEFFTFRLIRIELSSRALEMDFKLQHN